MADDDALPLFKNKPRDVNVAQGATDAFAAVAGLDYRAVIPGEPDTVHEGPVILRLMKKNAAQKMGPSGRYVLAQCSNVQTVSLGELKSRNDFAKQAGFETGQKWAEKIESLYKNKKRKDGSPAFPNGLGDEVEIVVSEVTPERLVSLHDFVEIRKNTPNLAVRIADETRVLDSLLKHFRPRRESYTSDRSL